jgi:TonB family protein
MQLKDTLIYSDDGSYVKFETSDGFQPETGEPCKKLTVTSYDADGTQRNNFFITETERRGDTSTYTIEPFTLSGNLFEQLFDLATSYEDTVYQIVEQMPQYTGGEEAMMKYVAENIKYPQAAKDKNISGRVFVSFVIEKDGSVSNVKVVRGIGGGCDEEAARVIKEMPKWKPGMQKGKPVRVNYMMPIFFKLDDGQPAKSVKKEKANNSDMTPDKNGVYQIVEEMPKFPGGEDALMDYVSKNVVYPKEAQEKGISGRVFVGFIVEKDGSVSDVKVLRGIGGGCDEEAVRVISGLPKWKPGKQEGKPVRVSYQMPINFKLQ